MSLYKFYNTDISGTRVFDIHGIRYKQLFQACFLYSSTVVMCVPVDTDIDMQHLAPFCRKLTPLIKARYAHYGDFTQEDTDRTNTYRLVRYLLTPEVKRFIRNRTDSIFKWTCTRGCENPEDLTFFRPDGTVFFSLRIREGVCTLSPEEGEDISLILKDPHWKEV